MTDQKISIQEYLSLGYLFLLIVGIVSETIYYGFLGVNILDYSSLIDVLISPISLLTGNWVVLIGVILLSGLAYLFTKKFNPWFHRKNKHRKWYRKMIGDTEKYEEKMYQTDGPNEALKTLAIFVICIFLGLGIGRGSKISSKIENAESEPDHEIIFQSGKSLKVDVVGQNSLYLFYVEPGNTQLSVSPIDSNIRKITKLE